MKKYFEVLRKCSLFDEIKDENLAGMLRCLGVKLVNYSKHETIVAEGEAVKEIGIVLAGTVRLERVDFRGNRSIVNTVEASEVFGESFACADAEKIPFYAIAAEDVEIMLIDCKKIINTCSNACSFHNQMIFNLLKIVATKNIIMNQKAEITAKRTTREKLMAYLLLQAKKNGSNCFTIPFDRQALADYLEVDRSGLSTEISKLRKEGVIESKKSRFHILS